MMETLLSASGFASESSLSALPRTPPYTPSRAKRRLERGDSPASSNAGSIHPTETSSPHKKVAKQAAQDHVQVQELVEGDTGYQTDIDVVTPDEIEEASSDSSDHDNDDDSDSSSASDAEAADVTRDLSRMRCDDEEHKDFEQHRRRMRLHRRTDSRIFKRSHSQSVKSETEATDAEDKDGHDVQSSRRRLRRRVQGPVSPHSPLHDSERDSLDEGHLSASTSSQFNASRPATADESGMDLDTDK